MSGGSFPGCRTACQVALFPGCRTACQVALFRLQNGRSLCSSPTSDRLLSGGSRTYPWLQGNAPHGNMGQHVNQQVLASFQRPPKMSLPSVFWLSLDFGQGMHPYPRDEELSARELLDLHFHRGPIFQCSRIAHSETCEKKAKTKARGQSRGESPKGRHQVPKLGDDQERRNTQARRHTPKWRKTD